ncbi:helix-turn-helix domain-containing protein [Nocardia sp. NPDC004722]
MGTGVQQDGAMLWDIACPRGPSRLPGLTMAGFGDRGRTPAALRLIPHPAVTLLLVFGGTIALRDPAGARHVGSFAIGPGYGGVFRALQVDTFDCLQIRLSPLAAHAVLGPAVAELDNAVVSLEDLSGSDATRISEQLGALGDWRDRFARTENWLLERTATATDVHPEVARAWHRLIDSRGTARIEELAAEVGWSRKRLWSRFGTQLGLPPKQAAKLIRFDHAVHDLVAGRSLAAVAAARGYTDQSHLHRDIMSFTGSTPATVVDEPFLAVDHLAWGRPARPQPAMAMRTKGMR